MFEQELYNEPVKTQEGDLFHNYEIKNWELGPRFYKILATSAILNLAAIGFIAQTDLLTRKGCDSPWAGRVCQVLDMAYVGTMLFGTEREYVDKEYEKIDLGDSDITFIDASNIEPRFSYPPTTISTQIPRSMRLNRRRHRTRSRIIPAAFLIHRRTTCFRRRPNYRNQIMML